MLGTGAGCCNPALPWLGCRPLARAEQSVRYISTRGDAPELGLDDVLLTGLARDGGLYVPATWPRFSTDDIRTMRDLSYPELAARIMAPFATGTTCGDDLAGVLEDAYAGFTDPQVAPLVQLDGSTWLMELFHGPTLAFKDYALQVLGRLFDRVLRARGERITIVGATSGDTGSAAIEACRDREAIDIFILFPRGRVSPVQQLQMTTVDAVNVHAISLDGTFDTCQDMVKALFNDLALRDRLHLSAVNSINLVRLLPQIVYYFRAALALGAPDRRVAFAVPSGNFGNVYSAYAAAALGLPVDRLVVATNANDILARFFASGRMQIAGVQPTLSPSMDIQVSSNFERLLFDLAGRNGARTGAMLTGLRTEGVFEVTGDMHRQSSVLFDAEAVTDDDTVARIARVHRETSMLIDPHSAVGVEAAVRARRRGALADGVPVVCLATAHPAKFPDAVARAVGHVPEPPGRIARLGELEEHLTMLPDDYRTVADFIAAHSRTPDRP